MKEASSLLFGPGGGGGGGVPVRTQKHGGVSTITRTMIVTTACVVLGTLVMLSGRRDSRSNNRSTAKLDGGWHSLEVFDSSSDYCLQ